MNEQVTAIQKIRDQATADAITGAHSKYPAGSTAQAVYWEQRQKDMYHLSADWAAA